MRTVVLPETLSLRPLPSAAPSEGGRDPQLGKQAVPAEGGLFTSAADLPETLDGDLLRPLAVDPAGEILVASGTPQRSLERFEPERVGVVAPDGSSIGWIRPKPAPDHAAQVWLGDLDDEWVVWAEGTSTQLEFLDSTIYSAPRVERIGALFAAVDRCSAAGAAPGPSFVYWPTSSKSGNVFLRGTPGIPSTKDRPVGAAGTGSAGSGSAASGEVRELAVCGDTVASVRVVQGSQQAGADLVVQGPKSVVPGGTLVFRAGASGIDGLRMSVGYAAFSTFNGSLDGGQWIYRFDRGRLFRLPQVPGRQSVLLAGKRVVYVSPRTKDWNRAGTASLP